LNSDFQQEFVGDAFLAPCRIVRRHFNNQTSARRQAHVDGHGVAISISKTLGTRCGASESVCRVGRP
jgi:hypothetical protein